MTLIPAAAPRILARESFATQAYWTSGRSGVLHLARSKALGRWLHPFWNIDESDPDVEIAPVSGRGTVFTYTVNCHGYNPQVPPPYVIAIVELVEQSDLRIVTNIVNCAPDVVGIGLPVRVAFEHHDPLYVPVFEPDL